MIKATLFSIDAVFWIYSVTVGLLVVLMDRKIPSKIFLASMIISFSLFLTGVILKVFKIGGILYIPLTMLDELTELRKALGSASILCQIFINIRIKALIVTFISLFAYIVERCNEIEKSKFKLPEDAEGIVSSRR